MDPETRRREIIDAARPLFSERPLNQITLADIATAARCSRALVHSYFGGVTQVFLAVAAQSGSAMADVREPDPEFSLEERMVHGVTAAMDVVSQNRETWWAVMGHRSAGDPQIDALGEALTNYNVQRTIDNNSELIADTPIARSAIRSVFALSTEVTRQWFTDQITREEARAMLVVAYRDVIRDAIPAMMEAAAATASR